MPCLLPNLNLKIPNTLRRRDPFLIFTVLPLINEKDEKNEPKEDAEQIEEKGYLYNLISYYFPQKDNKDDIQENIEKIKDDNLKNLITSLIKKKTDERITWDEYINHPFFEEKENNNSINSYKFL